MKELYTEYHETKIKPSWSISRLCRALEVPRSSFYYKSERQDEMPLRQAVKDTANLWPCYGSERITPQLRRDGVTLDGTRPAGERRVRRLMREMGLLGRPHRRSVRTTDSGHSLPRYPNLVKDLPGGLSTHPDHVWVSDITYVALDKGFVYLAVIMDVFTRSIRGWALSPRIDGELTLTALKRAFASGHVPVIHHSDQGGQYAAAEYVAQLQSRGALISMAAVGCPEENGYAERVIRTLKEEHVYLAQYRNYKDAQEQIGHFIEEVYQRKRIHSALGYLTPEEFEAAYEEGCQHTQRLNLHLNLLNLNQIDGLSAQDLKEDCLQN